MDIFFFKQKTAYDVRISDWSSDVCSSDLSIKTTPAIQRGPPVPLKTELTTMRNNTKAAALAAKLAAVANDTRADDNTRANAANRLAAICTKHGPIGRASCRERVCPYV